AEPVAKVTASAENPPNETKEKAADGDPLTKWLTFANTGWLAFQLTKPTVVTSYALTSANDYPGRNPKDWTLQGSNDGGQSWTDVDKQTGQTFSDPFQTRKFTVTPANTTAYTNYRLNITANSGEPLIQLADLRLFTGASTTPAPPAVNSATVDILSGGRLNPGISVGPPMHFDRVKDALYPETADVEDFSYDRVQRLLDNVRGVAVTDFEGTEGIEAYSSRVQPHSPGL
ncbi:discoidin domain-containing protein, partial [Kibdelosporangium lantanae]